MKTLLVIGLGIIVVAAIVIMVLFEILEFAFGAIFVLLAVILTFWLYHKIKDKLD